MPRKNGRETDQEKAYVDAVGRGLTPLEAATQAGYKWPASSAYQLARRPDIQAAIIKEQESRLLNELLPLAVEAHKNLLTAANVPAGARVQAVKLAYDRAFGPDGSQKPEKEPHEMTADELASALDRLRNEAANRAKPVIEAEALPAPSVLD